jgi:tellurite resistance-related uncharacterized protein
MAFHQDDEGEWVAELSCLHRQHVRHRPPFFDRPWVLDAAERQAHVGTELDCPLCDRAELPSGLRVARTAGPFEGGTLPNGLRRTHHVADGTWGVLRVVQGALEIQMETEPPLRRRMEAGDQQPIPPGVPHKINLVGPMVVEIEFLIAGSTPS